MAGLMVIQRNQGYDQLGTVCGQHVLSARPGSLQEVGGMMPGRVLSHWG